MASPTNLLIITVDDMSCDSMGVYDCPVPDTSPRMDQLAAESMRFDHAHVVVGNCMPSRNVMWSGRYPHSNGVEGFYQVPDATHPHLVDLMQQAGYFTAIRGKVTHSTPYHPYHWDLILDTDTDGRQFALKDAKSYGKSAAMGIAAAEEAGQPFCVMINVSDPHKPFYAQGKNGTVFDDPHVPSRVFTADDVSVPGFLFEDPVVRQELAHYYSSVRRADDCVGEVLDALDASGVRDETLVVFLSDHGMPLPFAKTQVYHHSSRTPLMFRWPGKIEENSVDTKHMVSAVDLLPTILDAMRLSVPEGIQGKSFLPILEGDDQPGRDFVVKEYNENSGRSRDPMRAIQTENLLYIFNPWSNGERVFATATSGTQTYKRMKQLAESDPQIRERHEVYLHRQPKELYDITSDPDCLHNLIDSPTHTADLDFLRTTLEQWMVETEDHCLIAFRNRDDPEAMENYVLAKEAEATSRPRRNGGQSNSSRQSQRQRNLVSMKVIRSAAPELQATVQIEHKIPKKLGEQKLHVTLKGGPNDKRIERKIVSVSGVGTETVKFDIPESLKDDVISCAVFVGEDFPQNLQHIQSSQVPPESKQKN
ncbi:sulfatase family protein [Thalassoglobus neptunius]|uniref:sulfatase family protein n=1 Tax=Thalassoglobus neptunius TaxID=1938619 RepID=UPI0018D224B9|nr:sulfatase [Thalassoglobus neptunius]